jgi:tRNA threonylcarbamoyladenosine biosynthesis protein TsaB
MRVGVREGPLGGEREVRLEISINIALKEPAVYNCESALSMTMIPANLRVLAVDTSTARGSISLLEGRELAAELRLFSLETHSARLLRSIDFLLASVGWDLAGIGLVAAGIGPGSFTGIRIGVSTALGLAQVLSLPFAGISGLDAMAWQNGLPEGRIGIVMDAQRSQVYYAEYQKSRRHLRRHGRPLLCRPVELRQRVDSRALHLVGDGALLYRTELGASETGWPRLLEADLFLSTSIGRVALARRRWWRRGEFLQSEPLYIRPPDARRAGKRIA